MKRKALTKILAGLLSLLMIVGMVPVIAFAEDADVTAGIEAGKGFGTNNYYTVISSKEWTLVPGAAVEREIVINNASGTRRQVMHVIEVDPSNPDVSIVPGYNQIDKDLTNEANWSHKELTEMAKYYEDNLGYNIVGGMNTDLYYDTYAPRVLVYNGQDLSVKGKTSPSSSILYVFKDADGNISCDVKAFNRTEFDGYLADGTLLHAVGVSFGMVVKDGELVSKTEERTSAAAARSMVGIKEDGTLVICMNDGRGANNSVGFCNYEEGEAMLALGCKWAANCDGGGSSTFLTKRVGEETFTMRSVPCDGAQRPTAHGIFVASNVAPTGILDVINVESDYDFFAPKTAYTFTAEAIDTHGYAMNMPADATWALSDASFGSIVDGKFVSNGKKGNVDVQVVSGGKVVGSKTIVVDDPEVFKLSATSTTLPYSTSDRVRTITLPIVAMIGEANVYVDMSAVSVSLSNAAHGIVDGFTFTSTDDTTVAGVNVIVTYIGTGAQLVYKVEYGKGSEILFDFEDGDVSAFLGVDEMYDWAEKVGASAPIQNDGNYSEDADSNTFLATLDNGGQVRNGQYALGVTLDYTNAQYKSWSYNMFFYTGLPYVLRDVANGQKATAFGAWVYIPEGAAGLAMQLSAYVRKNATSDLVLTQMNFQVAMADGSYQNLNALKEEQIPESRWVYCRADLTGYDYVSLVDPMGTKSREPSFMRYYIKPTVPADYTFYFDDFTLDYSSAVDDRVLPTITNITYSTSDTAVTLENGATINGNKVAFSANVADNAALDLTSGKIFVDGVEISSAVAGGVLASKEDATLLAGEHVVAFEIKDELGNPIRVTRTFTVAGEATITISGRNDSGTLAEYDSIYYIDINAAKMSAVSKLSTVLKLQNANTWEIIGATVAEGFKATFDYNEISGLLTVEIEAIGSIKTEAGAIVSIPVRIWSWDGVNHVTDTPITPENQFKTTYCPVVSIQCEVVKGVVVFADKSTSLFSDSLSEATNLNVNYNPWHYHDEELTVLNKAPTVSSEGYENRTYCETCQSVVDWGTILEKLSHNYVIVNDRFVCADDGCGHVYEPGTGIFEMNGDLYYSINNVLKKGWQDADNGKYCYAGSDYKLYVGEKSVGGITYTFGDDGITAGAWANTDKGTVYSYGPGLYRRAWVEIDGKTYYFGRNAYMYTGIRFVKDNPDTTPVWYDFGEDGATDKDVHPADGLYTYDGDLYYCKDGISQFGLQYVDGNYYYFRVGSGFSRVGFATRSESYYVSNTNGLTWANGDPVTRATYSFDADGKMIVKHGPEDGFLYIHGAKQTAYKMVEFDGAYYFIGDYNKYIVSKIKYLSSAHLAAVGLDIPAGNYEFDAEGKLIIVVPEPKNGPQDNGYFYINDVKQTAYQLVKYEDAYYFIGDYNKYVVNKKMYLSSARLAAVGLDLPAGNYEFDAEGKLIIE